ncbi:hypothetical protein P4S93_09030 [Aneurinibacillus thermoaerophilus]|uniref:hypothetical protein n=1 Tax=Aneurinibacillus thermoaerophilus TaxID=143495 RepID=UPI002E222D41|nr:hypothetical protein [Aneurinibacillus thermoaerophilus]MED0760920.1 hypothetical protein [Aneurinibacillus thermoaerophilus]
MKQAKGRQVNTNQVIKIYYNLHKECLSVVDKATKLVVAYTDEILVQNAVFKVSEKGRQRVLQEKRKNVHAYIEGNFAGIVMPDETPSVLRKAYYNPYVTEQFIDCETGETINQAPLVYCNGKQVWYMNTL